MVEISANEIVGKRVVTPDGRDVGTLDEVRMDPGSWSITGLVVALENRAADELQLKAPVMGKAELEISPRRVHGVGDFVTLNVTLPQLRSLVASAQGGAEPSEQGFR
jgi:sporulation protein YlmC with PRC-barrel domain